MSVPSHCELLAQATDELIAYAKDVPFQAPQSIYVGNRGGRPLYTADAIRDDLATNMRYTVRWFDALTVMQEMGAHVLIEAPPGGVDRHRARIPAGDRRARSQHFLVRSTRGHRATASRYELNEPIRVRQHASAFLDQLPPHRPRILIARIPRDTRCREHADIGIVTVIHRDVDRRRQRAHLQLPQFTIAQIRLDK